MPVRQPKIVITGVGRSGTTLLVELLDALGLDTGVGTDRLAPYMPGVRAGLECRVDDPDAPRVVKDMTLGFRMREVLERGDVEIEHVIIPTRRLDIAAASRIRAAGYGRRPFRRGGLTGTLYATDQAAVLAAMYDEIIGALRDHGVPYTMLEFPRFARDPSYLFEGLSFLVPERTQSEFASVTERLVRPELIHEAPLSARERWRTRLTTWWMRAVRFPMAAIRRRLDPRGQEEQFKALEAGTRQRDAEAAVDDPTIRALEALAAERSGGHERDDVR